MSLKVSGKPLSILNLATYPQGTDLPEAYRRVLDVAQKTESWGYNRFWLAEHHGMEGVGSSATTVLMTYVAGGTKSIRVGSGGIMLPNHSPYLIAEQFGTLESLFPGRIDMGLGRAPGTDPQTVRVIRGHGGPTGSEFPEQLSELEYFLSSPEPGQKLHAIPGQGLEIPIWILGSSLFSAHLAARLGRPYAFAGHFAPQLLMQAAQIYRTEFQPSKYLAKPYLMVGTQIIAADSDEKAEFLSSTPLKSFLGLIRGQYQADPVPSTQLDWSEQEEAYVRNMTQTMIVGGPEKTRTGLEKLIRMTNADEVILTTSAHLHSDRLKTFEIVQGLTDKS